MTRMRDRLTWVQFSGALRNAAADWSEIKTCQTGLLSKRTLFEVFVGFSSFIFQTFAKKTEMEDQAQFSFCIVNNIPAGKAKRKESLIQTFYETSAAHFFDWLTFAESANQNYSRCMLLVLDVRKTQIRRLKK